MKKSLLDTDMLSFYLKGISSVVARVGYYLEHFGRLDFSVITYYEIRRGLLHAGAGQKVRQFEKLAGVSCVWPLDRPAGRRAAEICARLWKQGNPLDDADILIAGIVLSNGMILVTNNSRHFERIPELELDNWLIE
ncbi:MAG: type II toxin-antitoxin system VapC family toxin [Peptococcaceae bacterium]|nr:MAG: type II toxin-antitoxin system VapC family toxin [Peptococcaceae bacterium]